MKSWTFVTSGVVLCLGAELARANLPTTIPAPPPGNIPNAKSCVVGAVNELARYRSGLGCLLGNTTLAVLSPSGVDEAWARLVAVTSFELARYGSTVDPNDPEALYLTAAKIDLATIATPKPSQSLAESACAAAKSAAEEACVAFFCSTTDALRVESADLNELGTRIKNACGEPPRCLPKDLNVDRAQCNDLWKQEQEQLSTLIRTQQDVVSDSFSPAAVEAVAKWTESANRYADQMRESVLKSDYAPLSALATKLDATAAPALLTVESERTAILRKKLATSVIEEKKANSTTCTGTAAAAAACRMQQHARTSDVTRLKGTVELQQRKVDEAQAAPNPKIRLEILRRSATTAH